MPGHGVDCPQGSIAVKLPHSASAEAAYAALLPDADPAWRYIFGKEYDFSAASVPPCAPAPPGRSLPIRPDEWSLPLGRSPHDKAKPPLPPHGRDKPDCRRDGRPAPPNRPARRSASSPWQGTQHNPRPRACWPYTHSDTGYPTDR